MKKQLLTTLTVVMTVLFVFSGSVFAGTCGDGCTKACCATKASAKCVDASKASAAVEGTKVILAVSKMTCGSCVKHVTKTLTAIDGVKDVDVSLTEGTATVVYDETKKVGESMLVAAMVKAGYPTKLANANIKATTADAKTAGKKSCNPAACGSKKSCDPKACGGKK